MIAMSAAAKSDCNCRDQSNEPTSAKAATPAIDSRVLDPILDIWVSCMPRMNPCVAPLPTLEPAHVEPQLPGNAPSKRCVNSLNLMQVQLPNASGAALSILNTAAKRWLFRIKVCVPFYLKDLAPVLADGFIASNSSLCVKKSFHPIPRTCP